MYLNTLVNNLINKAWIMQLAASEELVMVVMSILVLVIAFVIYFLPAIIARKKDHSNKTAITVLNIFLGWSFLGWVIALVWSFSDK